jgi:CRISPR-associated exonuclease Cas4
MDEPSDDWVLLSEIEHWSYCPRQWAIIHLEQHFADNELTTRGHIAHERVDTPGSVRRGDHVTLWGVDVWSDRLRLRGRCDRLVLDGGQVVPVEHKSGRRALRAAELQVAGQAMCLEDMLGSAVPRGRLYLVATNELYDVDIDSELRGAVASATAEIRRWRAGAAASMPGAANDRRCPACSLRESCLPALVSAPHRVRGLHGATWWP